MAEQDPADDGEVVTQLLVQVLSDGTATMTVHPDVPDHELAEYFQYLADLTASGGHRA